MWVFSFSPPIGPLGRNAMTTFISYGRVCGYMYALIYPWQVTLLKYFRSYMSEHLLKAGGTAGERPVEEGVRLPHLRAWFRTRSAIILHLSNGILQVCAHLGACRSWCPDRLQIKYSTVHIESHLNCMHVDLEMGILSNHVTSALNSPALLYHLCQSTCEHTLSWLSIVWSRGNTVLTDHVTVFFLSPCHSDQLLPGSYQSHHLPPHVCRHVHWREQRFPHLSPPAPQQVRLLQGALQQIALRQDHDGEADWQAGGWQFSQVWASKRSHYICSRSGPSHPSLTWCFSGHWNTAS